MTYTLSRLRRRPQNQFDLKNQDNLKNRDNLKNEEDLKNEGVQTGNGTSHDKYNIRVIAHSRTNRKDNIFMQRRLVQSFTYILEWGRGTCTLTKHTRRWTYSALWYFFCKNMPYIKIYGGKLGFKFSDTTIQE